MTVHKKRTLRRWSLRILLFILLLPFVMLIIVRSAGWFRMRKTDREIKTFMVSHHVRAELDTISWNHIPIVYLKAFSDSAKKDAILFVHGSPGSMDANLEFMVDSLLLSKADVITYDRPGFGNSDFGKSLPSLSGQAAVLHALMDSLGYDRYFLAGHSYGAPVILETVIRYPRHIGGVCFIAGSNSPDLEPKAAWRKWLDLPLVRELLPVSMRVSNEELMPLKNDLTLLEDDWDKIHVPVSVIHGDKDILVPFANLAYAQDKLVNAKAVLTKVLEGQSHFILWTHKAEIVQQIIELMNAADE